MRLPVDGGKEERGATIGSDGRCAGTNRTERYVWKSVSSYQDFLAFEITIGQFVERMVERATIFGLIWFTTSYLICGKDCALMGKEYIGSSIKLLA